MGIQQMLLGGAGELIVIVSATSTNLNASTLFGSNYSASLSKRLIINSGVTVGSTAVGTPALQIPTGLAGGLIIENFGSIQGASGAAGTGGAGGTGGDAILAQTACRVINNSGATIYSGGGGGGRGGNGGTGGGGQYGYFCYTTVSYGASTVCGGGGAGPNCYDSYQAWCYTSTFVCGSGYDYDNWVEYTNYGCTNCQNQYNSTCYANTNGGAGGAGGSGGRGQGYNSALAGGSSGAGGSAGGTNAGAGGTGGTGGSGGNWGASAAAGNTGNSGANGNSTAGSGGAAGSGGGLAGFYINGLSSFVTLTNNGTVAGRTN